jgi:hypothetical protein
MALTEIRSALGIERVVWVDDVFGEPAEDLAALAMQQPQVQDIFPELAAAFAAAGYGDVNAMEQAVRDLSPERRAELRATLLQADAADAPANELGRGIIDAACHHLGVSDEDRWTFEDADGKLADDLGDDSNVAYVIDLKEGGGDDQRGLDILKLLRAQGSKGVAFILTHETAANREAELEEKLRQDIGPGAALGPPTTVISKERLTEQGADVEAALAIALKRAGLRHALHLVLAAASGRVTQAYASTATSLLEVEPERLEQYVYERGRADGVSELSVVERALSAGVSKAVRAFFGTDAVVLQAVESLRALQSISLDHIRLDAGPILSGLRNAEMWDDGDLINGALTPLANGDVFRFDDQEPNGPTSPRLFVLLGQPCDIALRADGKRISDVAMLVPLIAVQDDGQPLPDANDPNENDAIKAPEIPFRVRAQRFKLNVRDMAQARLAILDLACFRTDGCVRVEAGHAPLGGLLAGGKAIYGPRTAAADDALALAVPAAALPGTRPPIDDRLLLTMSENAPWDRVRVGARLATFQPAPGHHQQALPDRVTWYLRREGRIRAPYSSFLLERALRTLGRRAFDSDYTS